MLCSLRYFSIALCAYFDALAEALVGQKRRCTNLAKVPRANWRALFACCLSFAVLAKCRAAALFAFCLSFAVLAKFVRTTNATGMLELFMWALLVDFWFNFADRLCIGCHLGNWLAVVEV